MLPTNLALLVGRTTEIQSNAVAEVFRTCTTGSDDLTLTRNAIGLLTKYWKLKFWFTEPVSINVKCWKEIIKQEGDWCQVVYHYSRTATVHVINGLFKSENLGLCYLPLRSSRKGYHFEPLLPKIEHYEVVIPKTPKDLYYIG